MDRTKVMDLAERVGGLFRLAVLLQKRVHELVNGAPKLVKTDEEDPINIAMLEVEADAIELVDLSESELAALQQETQMASEEAEILEALRSRVSGTSSGSGKASAASFGSDDDDDEGGDDDEDDRRGRAGRGSDDDDDGDSGDDDDD